MVLYVFFHPELKQCCILSCILTYLVVSVLIMWRPLSSVNSNGWICSTLYSKIGGGFGTGYVGLFASRVSSSARERWIYCEPPTNSSDLFLSPVIIGTSLTLSIVVIRYITSRQVVYCGSLDREIPSVVGWALLMKMFAEIAVECEVLWNRHLVTVRGLDFVQQTLTETSACRIPDKISFVVDNDNLRCPLMTWQCLYSVVCDLHKRAREHTHTVRKV